MLFMLAIQTGDEGTGAEVGIDVWPLCFQIFLYLLALPVHLFCSRFLFSKDILTDKLWFSENFRISIVFSRQDYFLLSEELKISFLYKSSTHVQSSAAKGILMLFSSNTYLHGSQIPLTVLHRRAGKAKNSAFASNPYVISLLLSFTLVAWSVKIFWGKEGSSLASTLMGFTEHKEAWEKLSGWLTAFATQLPGSLPPCSLLTRRAREERRGNVADQAALQYS